jgi:hypothetical protein
MKKSPRLLFGSSSSARSSESTLAQPGPLSGPTSSLITSRLETGQHLVISTTAFALEVKTAMSGHPKYSIANPPWSMASLDLRLGLIPWITPAFDRGLAMLLAEGSALETHLGEVLPFAFFLRGGPGDSKTTAFRVCAPTQAVRASAEHWLMRAYLLRPKPGFHATLAPDEEGRTFSLHRYIDQHGAEERVFYETTDSFGREEEDFMEFLHDGQ